MKIKKRIIIMAIIFGLLTAFLTITYLNSAKNQVPNSSKNVEVVVALKDIPANVKITTDMVGIKNLSINSLHLNAIRDIDDVIGQISNSKIFTGEQIIKDRLAIGQSGTELSYTIPENMRAISIPINETTGVAGYISIGDKIDVLVNYQVNGMNVIYTQLQNIQVIQKGVNIPISNGQKGTISSITILVNPKQAEVIAFALNMNNPIIVTLRNPTDNIKVPLTEYGDNNLASWRGR